MIDETLIADLVRAGVDADLIGRVSNAILSAKSADSPVDKTLEKRRAYDRERRRIERMSTGHPPTSAESANAPLNKESKREDDSGKSADKPTKGSRLQHDWQPSAADLEFASSKGMTRSRIDNEVERFRNYWTAKAGKTATKLDWSATWRNWVLQSLERHPPPNGTGSSGAGDSWLEAIR
jgi:hypothetical protein